MRTLIKRTPTIPACMLKESKNRGFTLIEVVLALGVFLVSVLALIGLLSPMLQSIDEIEKIDEITSVVNTVTAFVQSSPKIATNPPSKFDTIYNTIRRDGYATMFVFRKYRNDTSIDVLLEVGFSGEGSGTDFGADSYVSDFDNAAGPVYRIVLSASPATPIAPTALRSDPRDVTRGIYTLTQDLADYTEGYLALEARIFAEDPPGPNSSFDEPTDLVELALTEPDFTFNLAIVR